MEDGIDNENSYILDNTEFEPDRKRINSIDKLHNLTAQIAIDSDITPLTPTKKINNFIDPPLNGNINEEEEEEEERCSLDDVKPVDELEFDTDLDAEDSWLYESPMKLHTPGRPRTGDEWLKHNVTTPELLRVRGSLSASLEVIAFENRKGHFQKLRKDSSETRKIAKSARSGSCMSLDWDYDESDDFALEDDINGSPMHYDSPTQYDSSDDILDGPNNIMPKNIASQLNNIAKDRQAWTEPSRNKRRSTEHRSTNQENPFALDWSEDEEEDLQPMTIDFNESPRNATYRKGASNPTIIRRGGSGIGASSHQPDEYDDQDEFVVKPRGGVKPRGSSHNNERERISHQPDEYDDQDEFVVKPRGGVKPRGSSHNNERERISHQQDEYDDQDEFVVKPRGGVKPRGSSHNNERETSPRNEEANYRIQSRENSYDSIAAPKPRSLGRKDKPKAGNIAKPVQRRVQANDSPETSPTPRLRGSASTGNIKPRGMPSANVHKANSSVDVTSDGLKVKLPGCGDGPVIRRRGAPGPSESGPTPRRLKEPSQGIPQVRRSTGSIPQKSDAPRPRQSYSPATSNLARPRAIAQSYQADF